MVFFSDCATMCACTLRPLGGTVVEKGSSSSLQLVKEELVSREHQHKG